MGNTGLGARVVEWVQLNLGFISFEIKDGRRVLFDMRRYAAFLDVFLDKIVQHPLHFRPLY